MLCAALHTDLILCHENFAHRDSKRASEQERGREREHSAHSVFTMHFHPLFHVKTSNRAVRFWFGHIACENVCYFACTFPCAYSLAWTMNIWQALRLDWLCYCLLFVPNFSFCCFVTSHFSCGLLFSVRLSRSPVYSCSVCFALTSNAL